MEEELKKLKSVLRSLVVSSPSQVDVHTLLRDYRNMVGSHIPLIKFGYKDPITFLREKFYDCFLFQGPATNPVLTLIVPDTLKHVDNFVQKQKKSTTVKIKGKRQSVPESVIRQRTDLIANTYAITQEASRKKDTLDVNTNANSFEFFSDHQKQDINTQYGERGPRSNVALTNFLKKRTALCEERLSDRDGDKYHSGEDDDSGRQTSSSTSGDSKRTQLEDLKRDIGELICEYPDGVWCTELLRIYRRRYGRELNFARFGYTSVLSVACAVRDVRVSRPASAGDWLLRAAPRPERRLAPRPERRAAPRPEPRPAPRPAPPAPPAPDPDDALPGIAFEADVFPEDCLHFLESVPPASAEGAARGAMLEVAVAEVYSPSHFWLLRLGERHNIALENMMDEMNRYYSSGEGRERALAPGAVRVGHYCGSLYDGDWHRSVVVKVLDGDAVKVRHVDYGTVERRDARDLRPLRREWAALEAQALRARLAGCRPPGAGRRWPHAAAQHFLRLVRDRRLVANVVAVDPQDDALEVFLIDTSTDSDLCLASEMIRSGHADARPDCALATSECYLYPRFEALERGDTPNFAEIHAYLRDGIALEFVEEYRRHVPPSLPAAPPAGPRAPPAPPRPVCLSAADCETFALLSRVSPGAAHRFMVAAVERARAVGGAGPAAGGEGRAAGGEGRAAGGEGRAPPGFDEGRSRCRRA